MDKTDETKTYLREFLPRAVFTKMKCLHWYRHNDTGALSMALFIFASDALRTALRKAGINNERMSDYYYGEADGVGRLTEWCCEVAAEIDDRVERDIKAKAIREAA